MTSVDISHWTRAQGALRYEVDRVTDLLRSVRNPTAPAVGQWNLSEVAMHLSQAWLVVPGFARRNLSEAYEVLPTLESQAGESLMTDIWELGGITRLGVTSDGERDLRVLADRLEQRAAAFFHQFGGAPDPDERSWLVEGVRVTLPTLTCHLLNETVVHGYDLARADGRAWPIEPSHAAMIFEGFLLPIIAELEPRAMVDQKVAKGVRATYELHIRGARRHVFAFDDGALTIESPASGSRKIDCHLSADPVALILVAWARKSQWSAIARGQLVAWGRKPWLGPKFRALMRNP